jgi:hypothetical protein
MKGVGFYQMMGVGFYQMMGVGFCQMKGVGFCQMMGVGFCQMKGVGFYRIKGVGILSHLYNTSFSTVCRDEYIPNISSKKLSLIYIKVHSFFIVYQITRYIKNVHFVHIL